MADVTTAGLARRVARYLEQASPDLPQAMVQAFAEADERRNGCRVRCPVWAGARGAGYHRTGYRQRGRGYLVGRMGLAIPKLRQGSYCPGMGAGTAAKAPPRLHRHHHHQPAGGRLTPRDLTASPHSRPTPEPPPSPAPGHSRRTHQCHRPALTTAPARVGCRAPTGDPIVVSARPNDGSGGAEAGAGRRRTWTQTATGRRKGRGRGRTRTGRM